jgi:putative Mn2+ efflux pump MntP
MPILGALLGRWALSYVQSYDHWIACGLLCLVGGKMVFEGWREKEEREGVPDAECRPGDPTRGWSLVGLSLATSIDAFGAGLGMAMVMELGFLLISVVIIGLVCGSITYLGMRIGSIIQKIAGKKIEIFGGLVLIGLGIRMLWI